MKYIYYVSYISISQDRQDGYGFMDIEVLKKITRTEEVIQIADYIKSKKNHLSVVVTNFIFLREE